MNKVKYIDELSLKGKRVLIRVDFNVPLDDKGDISDDTRIRGVLPTINHALTDGARVILASHMGRPKGKVVPELGLAPAAKRLSELLDREVVMAPDCIGDDIKAITESMKEGEVLLLENLRFHAEEEKNDDIFGKKLASLCDLYVNDAFATAHRAHASNVAITTHVADCAAGFLIKDEIAYFEKAMGNPERPLVAIIGGAKISGKIEAIENIIDKVDKLIIGGGMAFTFLKALGHETGKSLVEDDMCPTALNIMEKAKLNGTKVCLPIDCVAADRFDQHAEAKVTTIDDIPKEWLGLDIGPASIKLFSEELQNANPLSVYPTKYEIVEY